jgi:hypothetical protein
MIMSSKGELKSVSKLSSSFESLEADSAAQARGAIPGWRPLRSPVKGKSGPNFLPFETVIGRGERVRILDADLAPWQMICALRMGGPGSVDTIGTGWSVGPKTVLNCGILYAQQLLLRWPGEHD